jgi:glycosyltransferase involved in cell wall biosynthesis
MAKRHQVALAVLDSEATGDFFRVDDRVTRYYLDCIGGRGLSRIKRILTRFSALRRVHRESGPDAVVSFMDTMNATAVMALARSGTPIIAAERTDPGSGSIGRPKAWLRNRTYRHAVVTVQSRRAAAYFDKRGVATHVIGNPVMVPPATAEPARAGAGGRFRLVACGRLSPEKRIPLLINAFTQLAPRFADWDVVMLGDGPERAAITSLIKAKGLQERVLLAGSVRDVYGVLATCHAMAFTSAYEGFPNALAEAMAASLPPLACRGVSGVEDLIVDQKTGLLMAENPSAEELAAKLATLMVDPALRQRLGRAARERVRKWAPDAVLGEWERLIASAVSRAGGPNREATVV